MQVFKATDYGIQPGAPAAKPIAALLKRLKDVEGDKTLVFAPGAYPITSEECETHRLVITNTVGDKEFSRGESPHENRVGLYFSHIHDLTVEGNGARFLLSGKMTNLVLRHCENVTLSGLELFPQEPDMHELKVTGKTAFSVDFEIDRESRYECTGGTLWFLGKDYRRAAGGHALNAHWIGLIREATPQTVERVTHPLFGAFRLEELGLHRIRAHFLNTCRFRVGDCFCLFDVRRQYAGIFVDSCKNITLSGIQQRFNESLAFVAQDSDTLTLNRVEFAPGEGAPRKLASVADFMQISMCRGQVTIQNSRFEGAGDDCLNVHGIHFGILSLHGNTLLLRFMHPQTHGFCPLHPGDTLAFIHPDTLLETGRATVVDAKLQKEYEILLTLDRDAGAHEGEVIENISACPDVLFAHNTVSRIITRGLLLTTRGKVVVRNNRFISTSMSGILLSDDAKSWYESGMCRDVTIQHNRFEYCGKTPILIKPENRKYEGSVHAGIEISENTFEAYKGPCMRISSARDVDIHKNTMKKSKRIKLRHCTRILIDK